MQKGVIKRLIGFSQSIRKSLFVALIFLIVPNMSIASSTAGAIDSTYKYAKGLNSNVGSINFGLASGGVVVRDTTLTGYAWGENVGWINLAPTNGGVTNNSEGVLGGYAWGEYAGWINFAPTNGGVVINSSGDFTGYAWSQNYGWIIFNCATNSSCGTDNFKVSTDWRPVSVRNTTTTTTTGGTGGAGTLVSPTPPTEPTPLPSESSPVTPSVSEPAPASTPAPSLTSTSEPAPTTPTTPVDTTSLGGGDGSISGGAISTGGGGSAVPTTLEVLSLNEIKDISLATFVFPQVAETVGEIVRNVVEGTKVVGEYTKVAKEKTKKVVVDVVETPAGLAITNVITTLGVVGGGAVVVTSAVGGATFSLPVLALYGIRLWGFLLILLGLRKRVQPWGVVYDSITKQPLDPAYVVLQDLQGKEVATSITDLDGRFGFLVTPGVYRILANKTNYRSPSEKLLRKNKDALYEELYFGEVLTIGEGDVITKNIPMDPEAFDWNEFAKRDKKLMKFYSRRALLVAKISNAFFYLGGVVAISLYYFHPDKYNIVLLVLYVAILFFHVIGFRAKPYGRIMDANNGMPLSFAVVRVFQEGGERELFHRIADEYGRYYCLLPKGRYYITIEKKQGDDEYKKVFTSGIIDAKNGIINTNFIA